MATGEWCHQSERNVTRWLRLDDTTQTKQQHRQQQTLSKMTEKSLANQSFSLLNRTKLLLQNRQDTLTQHTHTHTYTQDTRAQSNRLRRSHENDDDDDDAFVKWIALPLTSRQVYLRYLTRLDEKTTCYRWRASLFSLLEPERRRITRKTISHNENQGFSFFLFEGETMEKREKKRRRKKEYWDKKSNEKTGGCLLAHLGQMRRRDGRFGGSCCCFTPIRPSINSRWCVGLLDRRAEREKEEEERRGREI